MATEVDATFARQLPKVELHAHLSGSISVGVLHELWLKRDSEAQDLADPVHVIKSGSEEVNIVSFFPLFDQYIYQLVNDVEAIAYATESVLRDFEADGVAYLELRTTPRSNAQTGLNRAGYVRVVNEVVTQWNESRRQDRGEDCLTNELIVRLILSIDRKMTIEEAEEVVDLAIQYKSGPATPNIVQGNVVGVDLCGNPSKGDVSIFTTVFQKARQEGLAITLHFAEIPYQPTLDELSTLLSWHPSRLGHVINVPEQQKQVILERGLCLELCLSCNILAKLTSGGFAMHHFGEWWSSKCLIALSTDDVGVFASPLSNEYLLAATHFGLDRKDLIELARSGARAIFDGQEKERVLSLITAFKRRE